MHTLTFEEVCSQPQCLLDDAKCGEPALVVAEGQPVFMAVPMGLGLAAREVRLELAVGMFCREQISVDIAARIAGLTINDMIDELHKRQVEVAAYGEDPVDESSKYLRLPPRRG